MEPAIKKLTSRKFLIALVTFVAALLEALGIPALSNIDPAQLASIAGVLIAWIGGETYLDKERIKTDQQVALRTIQTEANAYIAKLQAELEAERASE